jgi:hypothetical protein
LTTGSTDVAGEVSASDISKYIPNSILDIYMLPIVPLLRTDVLDIHPKTTGLALSF